MDYPTKEQKQTLYDTYSAEYERRTYDYGAFLEPEYETFLRMLQGPDILDLGCGPGRDSAYFAAKGYNPLCLDLSMEMLKRCQEKGLRTIQMNIEELILPSASFNGVWSYTSLTTVPKNKVWRALDTVHDLLKDKGLLFLGLIEGEGEAWKPKDKKYNIERFISRYQTEEVLAMMSSRWRVLETSSLSKEITGRNTYLHFLFEKS